MPREFDLEAFVRFRIHLGRDGLIRELVIEGERLEKIAGSKRSEARRTVTKRSVYRIQARSARRNVEQIGRNLVFPAIWNAGICRNGGRSTPVQRTGWQTGTTL